MIDYGNGLIFPDAWASGPPDGPDGPDDPLYALLDAEGQYRESVSENERLRTRRNDLMRQAVADGVTQAEIARETGLTTGRVNQIVNG